MTTTPTLSPWPAPTPADVAVCVAVDPPTPADPEPPARRHVAALLSTAKRLSSRSERAEHAALKEEQRIREGLADLPAGWFVLHEVGIDASGIGAAPAHAGGRINHLVVGPAGVFSIHLEHQLAAKVWVSEHKVTINGRDTDHLRQARFEARRAGGLLTDACGFNVTVQSVLVLIGAATVQTLSCPAEVHVRTQHDLRDWLCRQPTRLDTTMAGAVHDHLRQLATSPDDEPADLLD